MQPTEVVGLALLGTGFLLSGVGTLRSMVAVGPAYAAGVRPEVSVVHSQEDPRRILMAGVVAVFAGLTLINFTG